MSFFYNIVVSILFVISIYLCLSLFLEIVEFVGPKLNKFYADEVLNLDISMFPEPLHSILRVLQLKGAEAAPALFNRAMAWVWEKEASYVPQAILDEIDGMAEGMCFTLNKVPNANCNTAEWVDTIRRVNMLPGRW